MSRSCSPSRPRLPRRRCARSDASPAVSVSQTAGRTADERFILVGRIVLMTALLLGWELAGRFVDPTWISMPSLIAVRLVRWAGDDLAQHAATTVAEMAMG